MGLTAMAFALFTEPLPAVRKADQAPLRVLGATKDARTVLLDAPSADPFDPAQINTDQIHFLDQKGRFDKLLAEALERMQVKPPSES